MILAALVCMLASHTYTHVHIYVHAACHVQAEVRFLCVLAKEFIKLHMCVCVYVCVICV